MDEKNLTVIGITGNIGSGKSTVAEMIRDKGYRVVMSDEIAKELMQSDKRLISEIKEAFGEDIYKEGTPDRGKIAHIVFNDDEKLARLEQMTHPRVIARLIEITDEAEERGEKLIFIESALIYEAELEEGFDYIICVDSPEETAVKRAAERGKMTEHHVRKRLATQIPAKEKREAADFVIENKGDLKDLQKSVDFILNVIEALAG